MAATEPLFDRALALAADFKSKTQGSIPKIIQHDLEEDVIWYLLAGWNDSAISREIEDRFGLEISRFAIATFRRQVYEPLLDDSTRERLLKIRSEVNIYSELEELYKDQSDRARAIRKTEAQFDIPIDALTKIQELRLKVLQTMQTVKMGRVAGKGIAIGVRISKKGPGEKPDEDVIDMAFRMLPEDELIRLSNAGEIAVVGKEGDAENE